MIVKRYYPDETGKVVIDGITLRVRENIKFKNYCRALKDIKRIKTITVVGGICLLGGIFILLGSIGHIELYSLREIQDPWGFSTYFILDGIGTLLLIAGFITVKWSWSKEIIYKRWVSDYLGQYDTDEEAVG